MKPEQKEPKSFNPFENLRRFITRGLAKLKDEIMSAISDYAGRVNAAFDAIQTGLADQGSQITGIADDVAFLKEEIEKLQNNPGPITPEDQAILDALEARTAGLAANVETVRANLATLNAATQRPAPPVEG